MGVVSVITMGVVFHGLTAAASHRVHNYAQSDSVTFGCLPFSNTSRHKCRPVFVHLILKRAVYVERRLCRLVSLNRKHPLSKNKLFDLIQ